MKFVSIVCSNVVDIISFFCQIFDVYKAIENLFIAFCCVVSLTVCVSFVGYYLAGTITL